MRKHIAMLTPLARAAILLSWLVLPLSVQAASFDCAKASTKVEKMVCAETELSRLDDDLYTTYRQALGYSPSEDKIRDQRVWLREVRNACQDAVCLKKVYQARIRELTVTPRQTITVMQAARPTTSEKPVLASETDKLKFMQGIVKQHKFYSPKFPPNSDFCQQFLQDFIAGKHVQAVEPDFRSDDENDPRLDKWHRCEDAEQQAENVPEYRFLSILGGPPYRYYHIEVDGNPKNGKEDVIYTEYIKQESDFAGNTQVTLSGATGYAWVDLKACVVKGGAGMGAYNANQPLLPNMYRLSLIVKYRDRNIAVNLYPMGAAYQFDTSAFDPELNHRGYYCAWSEQEASRQ